MSTKSSALLDLTRLIRRAGRPPTGIDRVDLAYLQHLPKHLPVWGLIRTSLGYLLLDPQGCAELAGLEGRWDAPDALSRLSPRLAPARAGAEATARRLSHARCLPPGLGRMLRRHLPKDTAYINTSHSNFTNRVTRALRRVEGMRIVTMVHDTIPLDTPQYQRPETLPRFRAFLARAEAQSDVILCNSHQTEHDVLRHAPKLRRSVVAPLGVAPPCVEDAPEGPWSARPYFVSLGTIEPRKNHALLLEIWSNDPPQADLLICGSRGWENDAVFAQLDRGIPHVYELPGLTDGQIAGLLKGSSGLLFPSLAEGYGLPPVEAASLGVPCLLSDLPIYREVLGDIPVYVDPADSYPWRQMITRILASEQAAPAFAPPTWEAHFKTVLTLL